MASGGATRIPSSDDSGFPAAVLAWPPRCCFRGSTPVSPAIAACMQRLAPWKTWRQQPFLRPGQARCARYAQIRKTRGRKNPLSAAAVKHLRDEFARSVEPAQALAREAVEAEHAVSDLVNAAYGLTPDEIDLMWATAPPRMPITRRT